MDVSGFTEENRKAFIVGSLKEQPEKLKKWQLILPPIPP